MATNFSNGLSSYGIPVLPKFDQLQTGSVWFVDSVTGSNGNSGKTTKKPFATLDYAIGMCTASKGDVIILMPGHAESVIAAAGIVCDVQGITIIGAGTGTDRPQITFSTATTADIDISAANVTIKNVHFINDIDALAAPIDVNAAHFRMEGCLFDDATAAKQTVRWILGDANADYMEIIGCDNHGSDTAGSTAWITLNGADHVKIMGCSSHGDFAAANVEVVTAAVTDAIIAYNMLENANAVDVNIEGLASSTGWIAHNLCRNATDAQVTWVNTPGNMQLFQNYGVNNNGETGILAGTPSV